MRNRESLFAFGRVLLLACACLGLVPVWASADETVYCSHYINSVPYTITQPGHYCLLRSLTTSMASGRAITIAADFVWLDLNDFALDGSAAGLGTTTFGIVADNQSHVTVRNGIVRGFLNGVTLDGSVLAVERIRADGNTHTGISVGSEVSGVDGIVVRDNVITNTGGTSNDSLTGTVGLALVGTGTVLNNDVINTFSSHPQPYNLAYGIAFGAPPGVEYKAVVLNNRVTKSTDVGISCDLRPNTQVVLRDNIVVDAPTPYFAACTLVGTTNYP